MAHLQDLPAELRNHIYGLAMLEGEWYDLSEGRDVPGRCQTSRFFRDETLPIWRGSNSFSYTTRAVRRGGRPAPPEDPADFFLRLLDSGFKHIQYFKWEQIWYYPRSKDMEGCEEKLQICLEVIGGGYHAEASEHSGG